MCWYEDIRLQCICAETESHGPANRFLSYIPMAFHITAELIGLKKETHCSFLSRHTHTEPSAAVPCCLPGYSQDKALPFLSPLEPLHSVRQFLARAWDSSAGLLQQATGRTLCSVSTHWTWGFPSHEPLFLTAYICLLLLLTFHKPNDRKPNSSVS